MKETNIYQDDVIYSNGVSRLTKENVEEIHEVVRKSQPVGFLAGRYDEALSITDVSGFFLQNLGYRFEDFMQVTSGSLRNLICGENRSFLEPERFPKITGSGDGQLLSQDGVPVYARLRKQDCVNAEGEKIWVMSAKIDWTRQNLYLVNNIIQSGLWYIDCDENGGMREITYSHEFRRMLGYHDILDFPNEMDSWSRLLYPEDAERVQNALNEVLQDRTGKKKSDGKKEI